MRGEIFLELLRSAESKGMSQIQTGSGKGVPAQPGDRVSTGHLSGGSAEKALGRATVNNRDLMSGTGPRVKHELSQESFQQLPKTVWQILLGSLLLPSSQDLSLWCQYVQLKHLVSQLPLQVGLGILS